MTPADARAQLEDIGRRIAEAEAQRAAAMADLRRVARAARNVVPISRIAELSRVTRPTIYKLFEDD